MENRTAQIANASPDNLLLLRAFFLVIRRAQGQIPVKDEKSFKEDESAQKLLRELMVSLICLNDISNDLMSLYINKSSLKVM